MDKVRRPLLFLSGETFRISNELIRDLHTARAVQITPDGILLAIHAHQPQILMKILQPEMSVSIRDEQNRGCAGVVRWLARSPVSGRKDEIICRLRLNDRTLYNQFCARLGQQAPDAPYGRPDEREHRTASVRSRKKNKTAGLVRNILTLGGTLDDMWSKIRKGF